MARKPRDHVNTQLLGRRTITEHSSFIQNMHELIESFAAFHLMRIFSAPVVQQKHNNNLILAITQMNRLVHDQMRGTIQHNTNDGILDPLSPLSPQQSLGSFLYRSRFITACYVVRS